MSSFIWSNISNRPPFGISQGTSPEPPALVSPQHSRGQILHPINKATCWGGERFQNGAETSQHQPDITSLPALQQQVLTIEAPTGWARWGAPSLQPPGLALCDGGWTPESKAQLHFIANKEESNNDKPSSEQWGNGRPAIDQSERRPSPRALCLPLLPSCLPLPVEVPDDPEKALGQSCHQRTNL